MRRRPETGAEVVLRDQSGGSHECRASELSDDRLALEMADGMGAGLQCNDRILVTWPEAAGLVCLPVVLVEHDSERPSHWVADIDGEAWLEQRRQFPRAPVSGTVGLRPVGSQAAAVATGFLLDLSEAGMRCTVEDGYRSLGQPATDVDITLALEAGLFRLSGKVLYGRQATHDAHRLELVVIFDRPVPQVDQLRDLIERSQA
ncbi:PilZ domain-containing protein [Jatrophihabitans sp. DSM 45814]